MVITVRDLGDEAEWERQYAMISSAFGGQRAAPAEPFRSATRGAVDQRLSIVVCDDGEHIGGCAASLFDLSLPGGSSITTSGLTGVGVRPDRRNRGAMRAMVVEHLKRSVDLGAAGSLLMATEPSIYGRFGYGLATSVATHRINIDRAELADGFEDPGEIALFTGGDEQRTAVAEVYERMRSLNPGMTSRNDGWWRVVLSDEDLWKGPASPFVAIHRDAAGEPDGYALYVVEQGKSGLWRPDGVVVANELVAGSLDAEKALWQFLTEIPLMREVRWHLAPVEPRLRLLLAHRRELDTEMVNDMLWLRPLDVVALLEARTYERDGVATFGVNDELFPDQAGPWKLTVLDGQGLVERVESTDVMLSPEQLGMIVLGGSSLRSLQAAGLVDASATSVAVLSDVLVTTEPPRSVSRF